MEQETLLTKWCPKCRLTQPISNFYKHKGMTDGLQYYCKNCHRKQQQSTKGKKLIKKYQTSEKGREVHRRAMKKYSQTERGKAILYKNVRASSKKYPIKYHSRKLVYHAIKLGMLQKLPCKYPDCKHGDARIEAHHWDYSKPLDVVWFCTKHHKLIDKISRLINR